VLIKLAREEGSVAKERVLLKQVKTIDDLAQLYGVLMVLVEHEQEFDVEIWTEYHEVMCEYPRSY
jgi:hypothetical protein